LKKVRSSGNRLILHYHKKSLKGGLVTSDKAAPKHFYIASADSVYAEALAVIRGKRVILSSGKVKNPQSVRYAFFNAAQTNLMNGAGLPAWPFRTDQYRNVTYK
jgi:sialate O-acetylesterase